MPPFVDWNIFKDRFEQEATRIIGQEVTVAGDVDLTLLPVPRVTFSDVRIGDREGESMMTMQRFSAQLEIPPLVSGNVQFDQIQLDRPRLNINVDDAGQIDWSLGGGTLPTVNLASIALQSVSVTDGYLVFTDGRSGVRAELRNIDTTRVTARSLTGPWTIEGTGIANGTPIAFRVATGSLQANALRVTGDFQVGGGPPLAGTIHSDGTVSLADGQLAYGGTFRHQQFSAPVDEEQSPFLVASASGDFLLTAGQLSLTDFAWESETGEGIQELAGSGVISFGTDARFNVDLSTRQIDVDRLLGTGPSAPMAVGPALARLTRVPPALPPLPIDGHVQLSVPSVVLGGAVVKDLHVSADHVAGAWLIDQAEASLPGQARVGASGSLAVYPALEFTGAVEVDARQPETFANWLFGPRGGAPIRSIGRLSLEANAEIGPGGIDLTGVEALVDGKPLAATFQWRQRDGGARVLASAAAFSLPVQVVQGLAELRDLRVGGPANEVAEIEVALRVDEVTTANGVPLGMIDLGATLSRDMLRVRRLRLDDFAGGHLSVTGAISEPFSVPTGSLTARLDANDLGTLSRFARTLLPDDPISARVAANAALLAPAHISTTLVVGEGPGVRIDVDGELARTHVDGTLTLAGERPDPLATLLAWRDADWTARLSIENPDAARLAEQLGFEIAPIEDLGVGALRLSPGAPAGSGVGPAILTVEGAGSPSSTFEGSVKGEFGGVELDVTGQFALPENAGPSLSADIALSSADIDPILMMAGLALPGTGLGTPLRLEGRLTLDEGAAQLDISSAALAGSDVTGAVAVGRDADAWRVDGTLGLDRIDVNWLAALELGAPIEAGAAAVEGSVWDAEAFGSPVVPPLRGELEVSVAHLFASGSDVAIDDGALLLHFQPDALAVELVEGSAFGTSVGGTFSVRNSSGDAALSGSFAMSGADLGTMVWRDGDAPVAEGVVDLALDFETTGRSVAGLWSNLAGGGTLEFRDATVRGIDGGVFREIIDASDAGSEFAEEDLEAKVTEAFAGGAMPVERASATFTMIGGMLEAANVAVDLDDYEATGGVSIDLNTMTIDGLLQISLADPEALVVGAPPELDVGFTGPLAGPSRIIDVGALLAYLNLRTLDREVKLLEDAQAGARTGAEAPAPNGAVTGSIPLAPDRPPTLAPPPGQPSAPVAGP